MIIGCKNANNYMLQSEERMNLGLHCIPGNGSAGVAEGCCNILVGFLRLLNQPERPTWRVEIHEEHT